MEKKTLLRFVTEDEVGVLGIVSLIAEENLNVSYQSIFPRKDGKVIIEVQIDGSIDLPTLKEKNLIRGNVQTEGIYVLQQSLVRRKQSGFFHEKRVEQKMERNDKDML